MAVETHPLTAGELAHGLVARAKLGLQKLGVRIDGISEDEAAERMATCLGCSNAVPNAAGKVTSHSRCSKCNCPVVDKVKLGSEHCPGHFWVEHLHSTNIGIGDAICAVYAAVGMIDALGCPVVYHARHSGWLDRIKHPSLTIAPLKRVRGIDVRGGEEGYQRQLASARSRCSSYCQHIVNALDNVPLFTADRPAMIDRTIKGKIPAGDYAVVSPFSYHADREWPLDRWESLTRSIREMGIEPIIIRAAPTARELQTQFRGLRTIADAKPDDIIDLMLGSKFVVANDSGMAHVAGLFDVPTISIHAGGLPHQFLFDESPSVRSVVAGELPRSASHQHILADIPVEKVTEAIRETIRPKPTLGRVIVCTGCYDPGWAVHKATLPSKRAWCQKHGYELLTIEDGTPKTFGWRKIELFEQHIQNYDAVVWMDADSLVTNPEIGIDRFVDNHHALYASRDWCPGDLKWLDPRCQFSAGNLILVKGEHQPILNSLRELRPHVVHEQAGLQRLMRDREPGYDRIRVLPGPWLNAVPRDLISGSANQWTPRQLLAHLTNASEEDRLKWIREHT